MGKSRFQAHKRISAVDHELVKQLARANQNVIACHISENRNHLVVTLLTKSLVWTKQGVQYQEKHAFKMTCPPQYPDEPPIITAQGNTPWHPNIAPNGGVLLTYWHPGMHLVDGIEALWRMLTYQLVDESLIANREAFTWVSKNKPSFPLSNQQLQPVDENTQVAAIPAPIVRIHEGTSSIDTPASPSAKSTQRKFGITAPYFRPKGPIRRYTPEEREYPWSNSLNPLRVVLREATLRKIEQHGKADTNNERFGLLIGGAFSDPITKQNWVEVVDMLPAKRVSASRSYVEVQPEELISLRDQIGGHVDNRFREVGWYHTHPGHGIFMSGTDRSNQKLNYNEDWQIALVYDPTKGNYGIFSGKDCLEVGNIQIIPDYQGVRAWESWQLKQPFKDFKPLPERRIPGLRNESAYQSTKNNPNLKPVPIVISQAPRESSWTRHRLAVVLVLGLLIFFFGFWTRGHWQNIEPDPTVQRAQIQLLQASRVAIEEGNPATARHLLQALISLNPGSREGLMAKDILDEIPTPHAPQSTSPTSLPSPTLRAEDPSPVATPTLNFDPLPPEPFPRR